MKLKSTQSVSVVSEQLRRNLKLLTGEEQHRGVLRTAVSILTTGQDYFVRIPRGYRKRLLLACVSWYLPEILRSLIQLQLQEEINSLGLREQLRLSALLSSEPEMILYILESNVLGETPEEVFGNIRGIPVQFEVIPENHRKPKRNVRHRGYRDKGSLGPRREYLTEEARDVFLQQRNNQLEQEYDQYQVAIQISLGFIQ